MKKMVNWGILGCAKIAGEQFLPALTDCAYSRLGAIGSRDLGKAERWAQRWNAQAAYGSYEEVLNDPQIEAVYIPLPNNLHQEWTLKALRAGKNVLCEKPMAVSVQQCAEIIRVAEQEKLFYMEGFMYRFHPQIIQVLDWIKENRIGEVRLVRGSFSFLLEEKENIRLRNAPGGGSLWDVGCYPIHFMNLVFGGPPRSVMALADFEGVDLSVVGLLDYGPNQKGIFDCSFAMDERSNLEIAGTKGSIFVLRPWRPDRQEVAATLRVRQTEERIMFPVSNPYQLEIEHFQACLRGEAKSMLPSHLGLDVVSTIESCYRSAREGVKVSLGGSHTT